MFISKKVLVASLGIFVLFLFILLLPSPQTEKGTEPSSIPKTLGKQQSVPDQTLELSHGGVLSKVTNVVDGDTVKIESGEVIRLIGIDAPEVFSGGECYAQESTKKLEELVLNKEVELEKDVSETDRYKRLLRYIWMGDAPINEVLVREGFAKASSYPPDVKYQDKLREAERLAREERKGLWGDACGTTPAPTTKPTVKSSTTTAPQPTYSIPPQMGGGFTCNCSKTCPQVSSCAEAQYQLNVCGCLARDADHDGIACDADCQ